MRAYYTVTHNLAEGAGAVPLAALLKEQFGLRMQRATQQLTNTEKLKQVRRNIARARTLLHQKEQTAQRGQS